MDTAYLKAIWAPRLLSILRIVAAILFFTHGTQKILGFPMGPNPGGPATLSLLWFAGILEICGGALLAVGLFVRPIAFVLSGQMAFAYWLAHAPRSPYPAVNGGDAAILFCFVFLYFVAAGGGSWSLDRLRHHP
ncbi:MAG: DoxX family protein [Microvirga sp.]